MPLRFGSIALAAAATLTAALAAPSDARACGGCFHPEDQPETTVVTGHRMAFSISKTQTVLWDQIKYAGNPKDFAWVLPIKPGARIEVASDAWFEALDAATSTRVIGPQLNCVSQGGSNAGCGCGNFVNLAGSVAPSAADGAGGPPAVVVTHEGTIGPYETVTLHANVQGALTGWLKANKYAIDSGVQPIIDAYSAENFDFIALRLSPTAGIRQMQPVRVVSPGASPALPLRMVAAGTGANVDLTLFVIGEGRWEPANFPTATVDAKALSFDFKTTTSNYAEVRKKALSASDGRTWLNTYAKHGSLLSPVDNPIIHVQETYVSSDPGGSMVARTIGESYVFQAQANREVQDVSCTEAMGSYATSPGIVVDLCTHPEAGGGSGGGGGGGGSGGGSAGATCGTLQIGQIDARVFACNKIDDLAVALTGMHPRDVWLTRLEAALPRAALKDDLTLQAPALQAEVDNWKQAASFENPPCELASSAAPLPNIFEDPRGPGGLRDRVSGPGHRAQTETILFAATLASLAALMARRARRPLPSSRAR